MNIYRINQKEKHPKATIYEKLFGKYCSCGECEESYNGGRPKLDNNNHGIEVAIDRAVDCLSGNHDLDNFDGDFCCIYCNEIPADNPSFVENYNDVKSTLKEHFKEIKDEIGWFNAHKFCRGILRGLKS